MEVKQYNQAPIKTIQASNREIPVFINTEEADNLDQQTVASFGEEWDRFHQFDFEEIQHAGDQYFDIVNDEMINPSSKVLDIGCGSGRWTWYLHQRVGEVYAVDPSEAVLAADHLLADASNVHIAQAGVDDLPFEDESFNFAFCLGVLHHIPDTAAGLKKAVKKVEIGGHFLLYLYYNLDNRGGAYKALFSLVNALRKRICTMPSSRKQKVCDFIAGTIYWPLASISRLLLKIGMPQKLVQKIPLSYYADKSFFIMRNDALDRFGTPLEQRFSKSEIEYMMLKAGLGDIVFSDQAPFWHVVGKRIK